MDLNDFESCFKSAPGSGFERADYAINAGIVQGYGRRICFVKRKGTWADN